MTLNTLLYLSVMLAAGLGFGKLAKLVKLPNVTGYLVGGLLIGPSVLGLVPANVIDGFDIISDVALGFIAFSIGNEFKIAYFKRVGVTPIVIASLESLMAVLFVLGGLLLAGKELPFALVLSSIAAATAPAATIMVINQYRAKGKVTETLLSVVAIDDATALMLFGICVAIAQTISAPGTVSVGMAIAKPILEIVGALVVGFGLGVIYSFIIRRVKSEGNRLSLTVLAVFLSVGLAQLLNLSSLLLCMALGAAFANVSNQVSSVMKITEKITPPIFMLFFVASGAALQLSVVPTVGVVGAIYILLRVGGKIAGASLGGVLCKADKQVCKYLGFALLPQAGVAIGLSLLATQVVPEYGAQIRAVILCGTLIYELFGPAITKFSLKKAGEIHD